MAYRSNPAGRGGGVSIEVAAGQVRGKADGQWLLTQHEFLRGSDGRPRTDPHGQWTCLKGCGCNPFTDSIFGPCVPKGLTPWVPNASSTSQQQPQSSDGADTQ